MERARAIKTARAVLDSSHSHADAVALALHVLGMDLTDIGGAFSPSAPPSGEGFDPAAPASAPVSTKSDAASPARNLGSPSGFSKEEPTRPDRTNTATVPTVYHTVGMGWQDEKIASWLESHARGYRHGGHLDIAQTLLRKADQIRRREYLDEDRQVSGTPPRKA